MADVKNPETIKQLLESNGKYGSDPQVVRIYYLKNSTMGGTWEDLYAIFYDRFSDDLYDVYLSGGNKEGWWKNITLLFEDGKPTPQGEEFLKGKLTF